MSRVLSKAELETLNDLKARIHNAKQYNEARNPHEVFIDAEIIIGNLAFVSGIMLEFEHEYLKLKNSEVESGNSVARAESIAQASDTYFNYRKIKALYELGQEQVKLLKKFKDVIEDEYRN